MCEVKYVFYFREMGDIANERREGWRLGESREKERGEETPSRLGPFYPRVSKRGFPYTPSDAQSHYIFPHFTELPDMLYFTIVTRDTQRKESAISRGQSNKETRTAVLCCDCCTAR